MRTKPPSVASAIPAKVREARIMRTTLAALPAMLPGIAKKDAKAAKVRIDEAWVAQYSSILAAADAAAGGRTVARVDLKSATLQEREAAAELAALLTEVRGQIETHFPKDEHAQEAFGRGEQLDARRTGPLLDTAATFLAAWAGQWNAIATKAGVTEETMNQIRTLRDSLSSADVGQQGVQTANADGALTRAALFQALHSMSVYAVKVVKNVFGKTSTEARSLADPRPLTNRAAAQKSATKAKKQAKAAAAKAKRAAKPKKRSAAVKRRVKRVAVAAKASALTAPSKGAAKKSAVTKTKSPVAKKKGPVSKKKGPVSKKKGAGTKKKGKK